VTTLLISQASPHAAKGELRQIHCQQPSPSLQRQKSINICGSSNLRGISMPYMW
jgi:hypothetical protein